MAPTLRKATIRDVKAIHSLINSRVGKASGMVLPRPMHQLYAHLRDFTVAVENGEIIGCAALNISWENLAEVRSLVVDREHRGKGLGRHLVEACVSEAVTLGIYKVFVLTDQAVFFAKQGFAEVSKDTLPHKIWADCLNCLKFPDCDEIAMTLELE